MKSTRGSGGTGRRMGLKIPRQPHRFSSLAEFVPFTSPGNRPEWTHESRLCPCFWRLKTRSNAQVPACVPPDLRRPRQFGQTKTHVPVMVLLHLVSELEEHLRKACPLREPTEPAFGGSNPDDTVQRLRRHVNTTGKIWTTCKRLEAGIGIGESTLQCRQDSPPQRGCR